MECNIDICELQSIEIFENLDSTEIEELAAIINPMRVHEGEQLTREGDLAHTFFVVMEGNFMVYFKDGRALTLHGKGRVIGWSAALTPFRYTGTAVALTDGNVLAIDGKELLRVIQGDSAMGNKLMHKIHDAVAERIAFIHNKESEGEERTLQ